MRQGKIALVVACALIGAAPAAAATTANLAPATAGAGSHLLVDAQGGFHKQEIPGGMTIGFNKGFAFDPAAVAGVCSDDAAANDTCPANSIVGTGVLDLLAEGFAFGPNGQQFTAQLTFYRAQARQQGDPMGIVFAFKETSSGFHGATIGRVMAIDDPLLGTQIQWDKLPFPSLPPGMQFTFERLRLDVGAGTATPPIRVKPTAKKKRNCRKFRRHGKTFYRCRKRVKSMRCHKHGKVWICRKKHRARAAQDGGAFLTNPTACGGTWRVRVQLAYPSGIETRDADAPCTAAR
jgi:hypothetical protein